MAETKEKDPPDEPRELGDLREGEYWRIYRLRGGRKAFIGRLEGDATGDLLETIAERFGGGDYFLQRCNSENKVVPGGGTVSVEGPPAVVEHSAGLAPPAAETLKESIDRLAEIVEGLRNPPAVAEQGNAITSAVAIVQAITAATAPLQQAILEQKRPDPNKAILKAFTAGLDSAMKMAKLRGGGAEKRDPMDRLLDDVLLPLVDRIAEAGDEGDAAGVVALNPPESWEELVAPWLSRLVPYAQQGAKPDLYAELVLTQAPDGSLDVLLDAIESDGDDFYTSFFESFPETRAESPWWRAFLGRLWYRARGAPEDDRGELASA